MRMVPVAENVREIRDVDVGVAFREVRRDDQVPVSGVREQLAEQDRIRAARFQHAVGIQDVPLLGEVAAVVCDIFTPPT